MTLGGFSYKDNAGGSDVMAKIPLMKFAHMEHAGGGCILLDDLHNASASVANVCLSIVNEKRYQSLDVRNAYIGSTGIFGAADDKNVGANTNAEAGLFQTFYVEDTVEDWTMFINEEFKGESEDALLGSF
jgi:hypothetical protein